MQDAAAGDRPLPAARAFVVQVYAEAELGLGGLAGRVEHVVSGLATHFHTPEELLEFWAAST